MKKHILILFLALVSVVHLCFCQDIEKSVLPVNIANDFERSFPNATDIEWEMDGELFNADFDDDKKIDHEIWYNKAGTIVKHKQEISKEELPAQVLSKIESEFKGYEVDDAKKITEADIITFKVELDSPDGEVEIAFNSNGEILNKKAD